MSCRVGLPAVGRSIRSYSQASGLGCGEPGLLGLGSRSTSCTKLWATVVAVGAAHAPRVTDPRRLTLPVRLAVIPPSLATHCAEIQRTIRAVRERRSTPVVRGPLSLLAAGAADLAKRFHLPSAASPAPIMSALATISGSGRPTCWASLFVYGNAARKCRMQFRRARFLSSDLTIVHGASAVSV